MRTTTSMVQCVCLVVGVVVGVVAVGAAGQGACPLSAELGKIVVALGTGELDATDVSVVTGGLKTWMMYSSKDGGRVVIMEESEVAGGDESSIGLRQVAEIDATTGAPATVFGCGTEAVGNYTTFRNVAECSPYRLRVEGDACAARAASMVMRFVAETEAPPPPPAPPSTPEACAIAPGDVFLGTSQLYLNLTVVFGVGNVAVLNSTTDELYYFHAVVGAASLTIRDIAAANFGPEFSVCNYSDAGQYDLGWSADCSSMTLTNLDNDPCDRVGLLGDVRFVRKTDDDGVDGTAPKARAKVSTASFDSAKLIRVIIVLACCLACFIGFNLCLSSSRTRSGRSSAGTAV